MDTVRLTLHPAGRIVDALRGAPLRDVLFGEGVEFPCGGRGRCKGCRIRVLSGELRPGADDLRLLGRREVDQGWRLACQARAEVPLVIELAQWELTVLADETPFAFAPREGRGVAVDLGTTTIAVQSLDLRAGRVLSVRTALNAQAAHGADIMSRIERAMQPVGLEALRDAARRQVGALVAEAHLSAGGGGPPVREVVIVGNTVMHHLFCGLDVAPLSAHPFRSEANDEAVFTPGALGWSGAGFAPDAIVRFLPNVGGFVGSDLIAGLMATRMHQAAGLQALVDLGTNGEIVVGSREGMLCASTAAGPAFEGARISFGMRAAAGAVAEAWVERGGLVGRVIGGGPARGLCGSGLVDVAAAALDLGWIRPDGRLAHGSELPVQAPVSLLQRDVRELQLAKAAIAAGMRVILKQWGAGPEDVERVWLAGAFGNYLNRTSAVRIGLFDFPAERLAPAGNTALLGAKMALFHPPETSAGCAALRGRLRHVDLNDDPEFAEAYVDAMRFPEPAPLPPPLQPQPSSIHHVTA